MPLCTLLLRKSKEMKQSDTLFGECNPKRTDPPLTISLRPVEHQLAGAGEIHKRKQSALLRVVQGAGGHLRREARDVMACPSAHRPWIPAHVIFLSATLTVQKLLQPLWTISQIQNRVFGVIQSWQLNMEDVISGGPFSIGNCGPNCKPR